MLELRVPNDEDVVVVVDRQSKHAGEPAGWGVLRSDQEFFDPETAAAIARWASGGDGKPPPGPFAVPRHDAPQPAKLTAFSAAAREMVVYEDRVEVCGAEIWRDCAQSHLRDALALLSSRNEHGFVRLRGSKLNRDLGRDASNPISKPVQRFCQRASEVLRTEKALDCGRYDIITNKAGGYHFTRWMVVRLVGTWPHALGVEPDNELGEPASEPDEPGHEPANEPVNERQRWVLGQVDKGVHLTLRDVVAHFRRTWNRSTINRDMKDLRERRLLVTNADGCYVHAPPAS